MFLESCTKNQVIENIQKYLLKYKLCEPKSKFKRKFTKCYHMLKEGKEKKSK